MIGRRWFFAPKKILAIAQQHHWDIFSVGLYLGEERNGFHPTSALVELLAKNKKHDEVNDIVLVNDKAAWLFVCGRDVLMHGVLDTSAEKDKIVFVEDSTGNILGFGKVIARYDRKYRNKLYIKNILDKGEYLRRER